MIRKTAQSILCFLLLSVGLLPFRTVKAQAYTENFDNISTLAGLGWAMQNNSAPMGSLSWFQGNAEVFSAQSGAAGAYMAVNYNSSGTNGIISNWLITPNRVLRNGDVFTFYTRKLAPAAGEMDYPDRLEVRMSTNGASTNVGSPGNSVGDFTTLLLSVNPFLARGGFPYVWTQFTITISGLPAPTSGRIAFRYFVTAAGPAGSNSDYIGIDNVVYSPYVCPAVTINTPSLANGTAGVSYSQTLTQTGCLGAPKFAITAGALPPGLTLSAAGVISGTPTAVGTFNFTAAVNDASGCVGTRAYSISVGCNYNNPIIFDAPEVICGSSPVSLQATPAGGYFTGPGVTGSTFDPAVGNAYISYHYTDPYGCPYAKSLFFTVSPSPGVVSAAPLTQTICSGNAIEDIIPDNTGAAATYTWTRDNTALVTGIPASGTGPISGSLVSSSSEPVTVTFTITANSGGCVSAPTTVTVIVGATPSITGDATTVVNNTPGLCSAPVDYASALVITGSPAPVVSYEFSGATSGSGTGTGSGSVFRVGVTYVTITATSSCGMVDNSFTVTVVDSEKPVVTQSPAAITVSSTSEVPEPDIQAVTATDNCSAVTITHLSDVISNQICDDRYIITRTYKATDVAGNATTVSQVITVNDKIDPVFTSIGNVTVTSPMGSCTAVVNFNLAATDNSGRTVTITTLPASGSVFQLGTTTVTATATDACGNETVETFTVTVLDGQLPAITALPAVSVCSEKSATFRVTATNVVSYQWQVLRGSDWQNISGETGSTYTINSVTTADNGTKVRVRLQGLCSVVYSDELTLGVYNLPEPVINTAASICLDERSVQLAATPAGGTFEGRGVTGTNWNLEIPSVGQHTVYYTYTDANGCTAKTSKVINLDVCNDNKTILSLQAYPNPTSDKVMMKALVTAGTNWSVHVTDAAGKTTLTRRLAMREGWNNFQVDLSGRTAGIYVISLVQDGKRRGEVKIVKQ